MTKPAYWALVIWILSFLGHWWGIGHWSLLLDLIGPKLDAENSGRGHLHVLAGLAGHLHQSATKLHSPEQRLLVFAVLFEPLDGLQHVVGALDARRRCGDP